MKKILMVCECFGGGVLTYLSQLCNDMCGVYDIYLAYSIRPQTPENYKDHLDPRVHLIEIRSFGKSLADIANDIRIIKELRAIEDEIKPDIIHLHSSLAGGFGRLAYKGKHNAVVYTPHGYVHVLRGRGVKSFVYKTIERLLAKTNSVTLTCCESEDKIARTLGKRCTYIETGVNVRELSSFSSALRHERFTVFTLGRACVQKRPELFNEIAKLVPEARFLWIGGGEREDMLTAPNVEVTGWLDRSEALTLAESADVFVLCSFGEAVAMSLLENMYLKKLVLVSGTVGNISVVEDGVNGYVCTTAEQYAEKIKTAMANFPAQLTERAFRDVTERYNTDVMKKKYIEFYESLSDVCGRAVRNKAQRDEDEQK